MAELSSCATPQLPDNYSFQTTNVIAQDGTALGTDLYLPKKKGKFPTVLARTPYDKNFDAILPIVKPFLDQGFAVVIQDCRGRLTSKGEFFPFVDERKDGLDTVKWIKKQKWSNGKIGGFAGSYNGYTQIAIADVLDVATLHVTGGNTYKIIYPYGIFSPKTVFSWGFMMDTPQKEYNINKAYKILPLSSAAIKSYGKTNKFIAEYLKHEKYDDFWEKQNVSKYIKCPSLFMAGWYDMFIGPQFDDFLALDKKTEEKCRMVVGPWCHGNQVLEKEYGGLKYTYDPADPFPSLGGSIFGEDVGPADQSSTTSRTDQLIFDMEIKNKPLTLLGPINAELFVETDAKETDFFVSVQDVFPKKGPIVNIQTGGAKFIPKNKNKPGKLKIKILAYRLSN